MRTAEADICCLDIYEVLEELFWRFNYYFDDDDDDGFPATGRKTLTFESSSTTKRYFKAALF